MLKLHDFCNRARWSMCSGMGSSSRPRTRSSPTPIWTIEARCLGSGAKASRSEEHTSELQSLMRISYAVFCLKQKKPTHAHINEFNDRKHKRNISKET